MDIDDGWGPIDKELYGKESLNGTNNNLADMSPSPTSPGVSPSILLLSAEDETSKLAEAFLGKPNSEGKTLRQMYPQAKFNIDYNLRTVKIFINDTLYCILDETYLKATGFDLFLPAYKNIEGFGTLSKDSSISDFAPTGGGILGYASMELTSGDASSSLSISLPDADVERIAKKVVELLTMANWTFVGRTDPSLDERQL